MRHLTQAGLWKITAPKIHAGLADAEQAFEKTLIWLSKLGSVDGYW
jgi:hypothetical protein